MQALKGFPPFSIGFGGSFLQRADNPWGNDYILSDVTTVTLSGSYPDVTATVTTFESWENPGNELTRIRGRVRRESSERESSFSEKLFRSSDYAIGLRRGLTINPSTGEPYSGIVTESGSERYERPVVGGVKVTLVEWTSSRLYWTGDCSPFDDPCEGLFNPDGSCNCCEIGSRVEGLLRDWLERVTG